MTPPRQPLRRRRRARKTRVRALARPRTPVQHEPALHLVLPPERVQTVRHPLRTPALIAASILGTFALFWMISSSGLVAASFKPEIERELSRALNRQITVGRIEGGLFDRVVLQDVVISSRPQAPDSLDITIQRVVVQYSLWDILVRKRPLAECLKEIQLIRPLIRYERGPDGRWRGPALVGLPETAALSAGPAASLPAIPPLLISLFSGEIQISNGTHTASLRRLQGQLNLKDPAHARLSLTGRTSEQGLNNFKLDGQIDLTQGTYRLQLKTERLDLRPAEEIGQLSEVLHLLSGQVDLQLELVSHPAQPEDLIPGAELKGKLVLHDLALKTPWLPQPLTNVFGVLVLDDRRMTLKNLQAVLGGITWSARGQIEDLKNPQIQLSVTSEQLDLSDLLKLFPGGGAVPAKGPGRAAILLRGRVPDVTATASFHLGEGQIGQMKIREADFIARYHAGELRVLLARGVFARGGFTGQGKIRLTDPAQPVPQIEFDARAEKLELNDLGALVGASDLKGRLQGTLSLRGPLAAPQGQAEVLLDHMQMANLSLKQVRGKVTFTPKTFGLDLRSDWGPITHGRAQLQAEAQGNGWSVRRFVFSQADRVLLVGQGVWQNGPGGALQGSLHAQDLPVRALPMLPVWLQHLAGTISCDALVSGTRAEPQISARFVARDLVTVSSRRLDAAGILTADAKGLKLQSLELDHQRVRLNGELSWAAPQTLNLDLQMKAVPLQDLTALAGLSATLSPEGSVEGEVKVTGLLVRPNTQGRLVLQGLRWQGLTAERGVLAFSSEGAHVWLRQFDLLQPKGSFKAVVEADGSTLPIRFQVQAGLDRFTWAGRRWSGDLRANHQAGVLARAQESNFQLSLDPWSVDDQHLPPLKARAEYSPRSGWNLRDLTWGDEIQLSGSLRPQGPAAGLDLALNLRSTRFEGLQRLLSTAPLAFHERYSGSVKWHSLGAEAQANVRLQGSPQQSLKLDAQLTLPTGPLGVSGQIKTQFQGLSLPGWLSLLAIDRPPHAPQGVATGNALVQLQDGRLKTMTAEVGVRDWVFGEWHFKQLNTAVEVQGEQVRVKYLLGQQPLGSLAIANATFSLGGTGQPLEAILKGDHFQFIGRYFTGIFKVNGSLRVGRDFDLKLDVASPDLLLNQFLIGNFTASVHYAGEDLTIRTPAGYPSQIWGDLYLPPDGSVEFRRLTITDATHDYASVTGRLGAMGTSHLVVKVNGVSADVIARGLNWPQPWTGTASGTVVYDEAKGSPAYQIGLKVLNGSVLNLPFDEFSGDVEVEQDWLHFRGPNQACILQKAGKYVLALSGRLPLPQSPEAEARLRGAELDVHVAMPAGDAVVLGFIPYVASASGPASLDLSVKGTMEYPSMSGRLSIKNGTLSPRLYTPRIDELNADLVLQDNKLVIQQFKGRIGDGHLQVTNGPSSPWAAVFRRLVPDQLNLMLETGTSRIKLDNTLDQEFVAAQAEVHAKITGTLNAPVLGGKIILSEGQLTFPARPLTPFTLELKSGSVSYDQFSLQTGRNLWFYNDFVHAQLAPDQTVVFSGGRNDFSGTGNVQISKGTFTYLNQDFTLDPNEASVVLFQGREVPQLRALAQTTLRNVEIRNEGRQRNATIYLRVSGEVGSLKIKLESEPVMTEAQIVSLLTVGEDISSWSDQQVDQKMQSAGARMLGRVAGQILGRELEKGIKKVTPLDVVGVRLGGMEKLADNLMTGNTQTASSGSALSTGSSLLQDTQIDVGKYLTNDLFLDYRGVLKDRGVDKGGMSWQSYVGMEYNIDSSKRFKIYKNFDADSDQELFYGVETRMEFKGWSPADDKDTPEDHRAPRPTPGPTPGR